jgi:nitroimidazol reductase NimA-like FMN-containing flavoprotein (pyridoxamine 5'-phosphate oxidase superfamily)
MGPDELQEIARGIVDANRYMALGTADAEGRPWVSPVWYATPEYREYFWVSDPEARHSLNIAVRPEVSIVIYDSHVPGGWHSFYMSALAEELPDAALDAGLATFNARSLEQGLREWTLEDVRPPARHRLYRAIASEQFVLTEGDRRVAVSLGR